MRRAMTMTVSRPVSVSVSVIVIVIVIVAVAVAVAELMRMIVSLVMAVHMAAMKTISTMLVSMPGAASAVAVLCVCAAPRP